MPATEQSGADPVLQAAYSTITAEAIARVVEADYDIGPVVSCGLMNRGFNDVYELRAEDGRRWVARLSSRRARGPANIAYETAFLAHLRRAGLSVGAAVANVAGRYWRSLETPEGARTFAVFDFVPGHPAGRTLIATGKVDELDIGDFRLFGAAHADIHVAGETYDGPPSLYRLEGDHLLQRPLARVLAAPTLDEALRTGFAQVGERLAAQLAAVSPDLAKVACHGDNHGGNTRVSLASDGARVVGTFDFDDGGPGYLAYDLGVFLWSMLRNARGGPLVEMAQTCWSAYLEGYRSVRAIPAADFESIGLFVSIRNIWFLGEYASRVSEWGTEAIPRDWMRGQLAMLNAWDQLVTPPA